MKLRLSLVIAFCAICVVTGFSQIALPNLSTFENVDSSYLQDLNTTSVQASPSPMMQSSNFKFHINPHGSKIGFGPGLIQFFSATNISMQAAGTTTNYSTGQTYAFPTHPGFITADGEHRTAVKPYVDSTWNGSGASLYFSFKANASNGCNTDVAGFIYAWNGAMNQYGFTWKDMNNVVVATGHSVTLPEGRYRLYVHNSVIGQGRRYIVNIPSGQGLFAQIDWQNYSVTATYGDQPISYLWDNGDTTPTASGPNTGLTLIDANGCGVTYDNPFGALCASASVALQIDGSSPCDTGLVKAIPSGMVAPYTYSWNDGTSDSSRQIWLDYQLMSVTVTDANGCTATASANMRARPKVTNISTGFPSCNNFGYGTVNVTEGGTAPYTYLWSTGTAGLSTGGFMVDSTYSITVTDSRGCTGVKFAPVVQGQDPFSLLGFSSAGSCSNASLGMIVAQGNAASFSWSTGDTTQQINPAPGIYTGYATSIHGCVDSVVLTATGQPLNITMSKVDDTCGNNDGEADVVVNNGTGPFTYLWNTGETSDNIDGLSAGTYTVTVTDANGCTAIDSVVITESPLIVSDTIVGSCSGALALVTVEAGSNPVTYQWSNGNISSGVYMDEPETYTVTVTASNGCTHVDTFESQLSDVDIEHTPIACNGGLSNLTGEVDYGDILLWEINGDTIYGELDTLVEAGLYFIYGFNSYGCTTFNWIVITEPHAISFYVEVDNEHITDSVATICGSDTAEVVIDIDGGVELFDSVWVVSNDYFQITQLNGGHLVFDATVGAYTISVIDTNGCYASYQLTVNGNSPYTEFFDVFTAATDGSMAMPCWNQEAELDIEGEDGSPNYYWSILSNTANAKFVNDSLDVQYSTITAQNVGSFILKIKDEDGCVSYDTVVVTSPDTLSASIVVDSTNQLIGVQASGGVAPYTKKWRLNDTIFTWVNPCTMCPIPQSGTYVVEITDANGCTAYDTLAWISTSTQQVVLEKEDIKFNVFPNPTNGQGFISVEFDSAIQDDGIVRISNVLGQEIQNTTIQRGVDRMNLDITNLSAGTYLISIVTNGKVSTKKLVVSN